MDMKKMVFAISASLFTLTAVASGDTSGRAYVIVDNTSTGSATYGVDTNLNTGLANSGGILNASSFCAKDDALDFKQCNSFSLKNNDLQVVQRGTNGEANVQVGVFNDKSTRYSNYDTPNQLNFFAHDEHLFDLDQFRTAANTLSQKSVPLPPATYGSISWQQFIDNIANARTMYGLVRVKIPLQKLNETTTSTTSKSKSKSGKRYGLCGSKKVSKCGCGPGVEIAGSDDFNSTNIAPGESICGKRIPTFAQINVRGALMFDWVDCDTGNPIPLTDLPESPKDIYFKVSVPININPANPGPGDQVVSNIDSLIALTKDKTCAGTSPCTLPLSGLQSYQNILPPETHTRTGAATSVSEFLNMSAADQYMSLFPSGYAAGWAEAFTKLKMTGSDWRALGFGTPTADDKIISINDVRSDAFQDIPTYMYTGGLVDMHHHVNISGLVYVPQAMELEQKGIKLERKVKKYEDEHDSEYDDNEYTRQSKADAYKRVSTKNKATTSSTKAYDYHDHEYKSCATPTEHYEETVAAKQYISGAIIVRDSFYIEAEKAGGATIISNDPDSYGQIRVSQNSGLAGQFQSFTTAENKQTQGSNTTGNSNNTGSNNSSGGNASNGNSTGASNNSVTRALWMEIRPQ